tara:strand:+ start:92 stop:1453 length:1362 start_codon:yes stop_codon:yes gene_type:complete
MKKKLLICLLFFLFGTNLSYSATRFDGPSDPEVAKKKFFENRKLDIIEGLWYQQKEGAIYAIVKTSSNTYNIWTVDHKLQKYVGTLGLENGLRKTSVSGKYTYKTTVYNIANPSEEAIGYGEFNLENINKINKVIDSGCWSTNQCWAPIYGEKVRIWPEDIYAYNDNIKTVSNNSSDDSDLSKKFYQLNWFNIDNPKNHWTEIPGSNSEVNILEDEIYLKGQKDIDAYNQLLFGEPANEQVMLIVDNNSFDYSILINYLNEGYVAKDDWNYNPKELLDEMSQTSKDDVKNIKWIFEPQLSDNNYAYYSYEVLWDDGDRTIETAILSFGRKGYHEIKFVKKIDENFNAREFEEIAKGFADSITFQEGYRYSDYKSGDKTAAVGIGGLVAGTLGVKALAKAGVLAKLLGFAAKFWWIILAPLIFLGGLFNKKSSSGETVSNKTSRKRKSRSKKTD